MKKLLTAAFLLFVTVKGFSQTQYEVINDNGNKILKGIISKDLLAKDTAYKWWAENNKPYNGAETITSFAKYKDSIQLVVFMGTWCGDSHYIIPRLYPFLDAAGFSNEKITLIGVDRSKKTTSHLAEAFNIKNVPTIIVMKEGKEMGRVVEYGKSGNVEKELAEIVNKK